MSGRTKEIRDPIHVFIHVDENEARVLDSRPFQRLRNVHQLAMTYLVYPGATHRRFEHSLGVMHLAGQMYDVVTSEEKLSDDVRALIPPSGIQRDYWRMVLRIAALCHDMGHLPFSHAAEKELLPAGQSHEDITRGLIFCEEMQAVWDSIRPKPDPTDICKLALGPEEAPDLRFSAWEEILADLIAGDIFGSDRIDYLLRDSHHAGVAYGRFDHHRLIQTLKILRAPATPTSAGEPDAADDELPVLELGIERGGLESAEALQFARYFMFSQVYYHATRRIYDIHLKDFLVEWLADTGNGRYPVSADEFLKISDNEVLSAIFEAARNPSLAGHAHARRIVERDHFRRFYSRAPSDVATFPEAARAIFEAATRKFGSENVRFSPSNPKSGVPDVFTVQDRDGTSVASTAVSDAFGRLLQPKDEYVYIRRDLRESAETWLRDSKTAVLADARSREQEEPEEEPEQNDALAREEGI
jgi:HD superfamily phosphohydrolase